MPPKSANKRKKRDDDDDSASTSDSGPEDRNPAPGQKGKPKAAAAKSTGGGDDEEPSWELDKNRVVKVRSWKGKVFLDIREYYEKDGKKLPGKKGIALSPAQWTKFKGIIAEIDEAMEKA